MIGMGEPIVSEFISPDRNWDQAKLIVAVGREATSTICRIPLPQTQLVGRMRFLGDEIGKYFINKAYKLLTASSPSSSSCEWKWVWRLPGSQRIKAWYWRILGNCFPTRGFLYEGG